VVLSCTVSEIRWFIGRKIAKKSPVRTHPSVRNRARSEWLLLNFVMSQIFIESRIFRLSDGEEIMTLVFFILKPETPASLRTDRHGQTPDRQTEDTTASQPFLQYPAKSWGKRQFSYINMFNYWSSLRCSIDLLLSVIDLSVCMCMSAEIKSFFFFRPLVVWGDCFPDDTSLGCLPKCVVVFTSRSLAGKLSNVHPSVRLSVCL